MPVDQHPGELWIELPNSKQISNSTAATGLFYAAIATG
jgi:hypothetical protein